MVSCHCRLTSLRSVEVSTTSCARLQLQQAVRSLSEDASKNLVQAFVSCRLDYCNSVLRYVSRKDWWTGCSRFRTPPPVWLLVHDVQTHNAGASSATLATGTPERRLQGCDARSSVAVWNFTTVPSQRPSFCRCSRATTVRSVHNVPNMHCKLWCGHLRR